MTANAARSGPATLRAAVHGAGGPWLTLIHGGLVASETWRHATIALATWARVITFDLRGYGAGAGAAPDRPYLVADHARDVLAVWDELGVDSGHVVGFSIGGMIAQELALEAPERVDGLVLASTAARVPDEARRAFVERAEAVEHGAPAAEIEAHAQRAFAPEFREAQPEGMPSYLAQVRRGDPATMAQTFRAVAAFDRVADLGRIRCPTLVLAGGRDTGMGEPRARELQEGIPGAELMVLPDHGHTLHIEAPSTFTYVLADFFAYGAPALRDAEEA
jgi:3-oxoadipate enol-lactonase